MLNYGIEYEILCVFTFTNYYKFIKYLLYYVCINFNNIIYYSAQDIMNADHFCSFLTQPIK